MFNIFDEQFTKEIEKIQRFIDSGEKRIELEYKGNKLNSLVAGLNVKFWKLPLRFILRGLSVYLVRDLVFGIIKHWGPVSPKNAIYRLMGVKIGKDVMIGPGVFIDSIYPELITIGDGTIIGAEAAIFAHEFYIKHIRLGRVNIGKQAIIGGWSKIRPGVTINDGAVVGLMTLVSKDVSKKTIVSGIPAREIKKQKYLY